MPKKQKSSKWRNVQIGLLKILVISEITELLNSYFFCFDGNCKYECRQKLDILMSRKN